MPKILNLTIEQKAEKYSVLRKKWAVNMTIEERAVKWDEHVKIRSAQAMKYASKNKEKVAKISAEHYIKNKVEYDINRMKRYYDAKKSNGTQENSNKID